MIVADVMTTPALTIEPDQHVKEALRLLDGHAITALPVVSGGRLVGVVSEADLIREVLPPDLGHHLGVLPADEACDMADFLVAGVMNHHPISVQPDTDLAVATRLLTETAVKSLPVVDEDHMVVGVLSRRDVVRVLARPDQDIEAELDDRLRLRGDWLVEVRDGVATIEGPSTDSQAAFARATAYAVPGLRQVHVLVRPSGLWARA